MLAIYASFVLSVVLCVAVFAGITYAWFNAVVEVPIQNIEIADNSLKVVVTPIVAEPATVAPIAAEPDGTYNLPIGNYTVTVTATGDSQTGHCILTLGDAVYYTDHISKDATATFTLQLSAAATLKISSAWGQTEPTGANLITNQQTIIK